MIAFGGSYGGMLAAWMRFKYPNIIDGAIAASAPIIFYQNDPYGYMRTVSLDFMEEEEALGIDCYKYIKEGFGYMMDWGDYSEFNDFFDLCPEVPPIKTESEVEKLQDWLTAAFNYIAMLSYPYETNFLNPFPVFSNFFLVFI